MSGAVWIIIYDLDEAHSDLYLQWFNEVHIPEKLARPGYTWAAHYQVDSSLTNRHIALFGGTDSRVFYNPSPAQIKPNQSPETRKMMSFRSNSDMLIVSEEWRTSGQSTASIEDSGITAEKISLALVNTNQQDELFGAWLVQDYLQKISVGGVTRKYLASTGAAHHVLIQEIKEQVLGSLSFQGELTHPLGQPMVATRVWPERK